MIRNEEVKEEATPELMISVVDDSENVYVFYFN